MKSTALTANGATTRAFAIQSPRFCPEPELATQRSILSQNPSRSRAHYRARTIQTHSAPKKFHDLTGRRPGAFAACANASPRDTGERCLKRLARPIS